MQLCDCFVGAQISVCLCSKQHLHFIHDSMWVCCIYISENGKTGAVEGIEEARVPRASAAVELPLMAFFEFVLFF